MSDAIITVENLGKCYRLQHQQERQRYVALRDVITSKVKGWFGKRKEERGKKNSEEDFWALKDVSFEIKQGEVVGIIGRNGAGKSTLLKILSRITEPTKGRITLRGRVASLLEVGTGFHPELTGRENIFLNGAILGMTRAEVRCKFDEIVAFAEVEKFLDTPVKRYSSGMYVRLAFAVAAHLEPDILIVDEVLAVGDVQFQNKCVGKMQSVGKNGRTVLIVSHQMGILAKLCPRTLLFKTGSVLKDGATSDVVTSYLAQGASEGEWWKRETKPAERTPWIAKMQSQCDGRFSREFGFHQSVTLVIEIQDCRECQEVQLCVTVQDQQNNYVSTVVAPLKTFEPQGNTRMARLKLPRGILAPNCYSFRVALVEGRDRGLDIVDSACQFRVIDTGTEMAAYEGLNYGSVILPFQWV
jgi:lipopolysaccharide transport system ATP-binding protein